MCKRQWYGHNSLCIRWDKHGRPPIDGQVASVWETNRKHDEVVKVLRGRWVTSMHAESAEARGTATAPLAAQVANIIAHPNTEVIVVVMRHLAETFYEINNICTPGECFFKTFWFYFQTYLIRFKSNETYENKFIPIKKYINLVEHNFRMTKKKKKIINHRYGKTMCTGCVLRIF